MKNQLNLFGLMVISACFLLAGCQKEGITNSSDEVGFEDAVLILESGYTSSVVAPLEKPSDFPYYTRGIIEYSKNGIAVASINFGNGEKDVWATKIKGGNSEQIDLSAAMKGSKFTKVITKPLVRTDGCDYIVEGTIQYYYGNGLIATVDYGNGVCDELATKFWPAGSNGNKTWAAGNKVFSLRK